MSKKPVLFSVLNLCSVREGGTPAQTFKNTVELAQHAERLGFHRYWVAEHHNMVGIASSATAVVIGHIAEHTGTIRVGSGGIMLPNHAPLTIAEQFGTLESMFPGRIDLGLGRAPGGDGAARVKAMFEALIDETDADELIMTGDLFDQRDRLHSYAIAADAMRQINAARTRDAQFATANG